MSKKAKSEQGGPRITAKATIIAAVVTGLAAVAVAIIGIVSQNKPKPDVVPPGIVKPKFVGRVIDAMTEAPIRNAKVILEIQDVPPVLYTDSEGIFSFPIREQTAEVHIRVEVAGYEKFDRRVAPSSNIGIEDVRLRQLETSTNKKEGLRQPQVPASPASKQSAQGNLSSANSSEDQIISYRVVEASDRKIDMEIWYVYGGRLGAEGIYIGAEPLSSNGKPLTAGSSGSLGLVGVVGHKAMTRVEYTHRAMKPGETERSIELRLCMLHMDDKFECREFPYVKIWR